MPATSVQPQVPATGAPLDPLARRISRHAGTVAAAVGTTALAGWAIDADVLKGFGHRITMKPNAALGLIACGIALRFANHASGGWRVTSLAAAMLAGTLGVMTFSQHLFGWDFGIDQLLFFEPAGAAGTASPARMGPNASLSLTLAGTALIALRRGSRLAVIWAQALALAITTFATLAIVGYAYGAQELYSAARYTGIAWPTAVTLFVIGIGILAARPDVGPMSAIASDGPGGMLARRMLPPAVLLPLTLGYLRLAGETRGFYDRGLGSALIAVSLAVVFASAIWRTAVHLDEANRAREAVQKERDDLLLRERAAREEAERASRLKDEFLATLSHELRTPLNVILGWAHMLHSNGTGAAREQAAGVVARNAGMLARLVDDLLDISRVATGRLRLDLKPVDLAQIAASALEGIDGEARARGVLLVSHLDAGAALTVGDAARLQQVVGNLLSNALKFTPAGGTVEVGVQVGPATVQLSVRDTGQGIDPAFLPHVFDRFRQQDSTSTREYGGLGLGLSIVREVTELHGGTVAAFSDGRGTGSRFTVTLPRLESERAAT